MTTTIHAAYEGSGSVRIGGRLFTYPNKGDGYGGVMPKTARKLIREGVDPETLVRVTRDGTNVFASDRTLGTWAALEVTEPDNDKKGIRLRKYRPYGPQERGPEVGGRVPQSALDAAALVLAHP